MRFGEWGPLWRFMKDAKMDANLACKRMKTHQNKIDPATDRNTKRSIFYLKKDRIFFFS